jgi:hypothetical protein
VSAKTNQNEKTSRDETSFKKDLERQLRAQLAAVTGGLAPEDYAQAWWDWYWDVGQHHRNPPRRHGPREVIVDRQEGHQRKLAGTARPRSTRRTPSPPLRG